MVWKPLGVVYVVNLKVEKVLVKRLWDSEHGVYKNYATVRGKVLDRVALGRDLGISLPERVTFLDTEDYRGFSSLLRRLGLKKQDIYDLVKTVPFRKGKWEPVPGVENARDASEMAMLVEKEAKSIPEVLASISRWASSRLSGEEWTIAVEPLRNDKTGVMTLAPRKLYTGESARRAFDIAREMSGAFEKLMAELKKRYPDWNIAYTACTTNTKEEREEIGESEAVISARISLFKDTEHGRYEITVRAPFMLRNMAFHVSAKLDGIHVYPLAPILVKLPTGVAKKIYAKRTFHTKNWLPNLLASMEGLTRPKALEMARERREMLKQVPVEKAVEILGALEEARLVSPEVAQALKSRATTPGVSILSFLRSLEVSHPLLQAMIIGSLLQPKNEDEELGENELMEREEDNRVKIKG